MKDIKLSFFQDKNDNLTWFHHTALNRKRHDKLTERWEERSQAPISGMNRTDKLQVQKGVKGEARTAESLRRSLAPQSKLWCTESPEASVPPKKKERKKEK